MLEEQAPCPVHHSLEPRGVFPTPPCPAGPPPGAGLPSVSLGYSRRLSSWCSCSGTFPRFVWSSGRGTVLGRASSRASPSREVPLWAETEVSQSPTAPRSHFGIRRFQPWGVWLNWLSIDGPGTSGMPAGGTRPVPGSIPSRAVREAADGCFSLVIDVSFPLSLKPIKTC